MSAPLGYQWLIEHHDLRALPLDECAYVSNIRGGRGSSTAPSPNTPGEPASCLNG